jgi:hypothetical protein
MSFCRNSKFWLSLFSLLILSACATNQTGINAERIDTHSNASVNVPETFIDDATKIQQGYWLPDHEVKRVAALMADKSDAKTKMAKLTQFFCNGTKARIKPSFSILLIPLQAPVGTPVDEAAKKRAAFNRTAIAYLQRSFLYQASKDLNQELPDRYVLSLFPTTVGPGEDSIVNFYRNLHFDPELPREDLSEFEQSSEENFFLIGIPGKDRMLMLPKVARSVWIRDTPDHKKKSEINTIIFGGITGRQYGQLFKQEAAMYVPSHSWQFDKANEKLTALQPTFFADLALLRKAYTFLFPKEFQETVFHLDRTNFIGITYEGQVSPAKAIEDQDWTWYLFLKTFTELTSSTREDGMTDVRLQVNFQPFCEFNRALTELLVN